MDIGAGPGLLTLEMATEVGSEGTVIALDPSQSMRAIAEHRCRNCPWVSVVDGDATALPAEDASLDALVATQVYEYVPDMPKALREAFRVLKPGGHFVARTPNRWHYVPFIAQATPLCLHKYINYMRGRAMCDTFKTYYRANSSRRITALAEEVGLTVAEIGLHEGKPEYLRFNGLAYMLGIGYQRVASTRTFAGIRPLLIFYLVKPATQ